MGAAVARYVTAGQDFGVAPTFASTQQPRADSSPFRTLSPPKHPLKGVRRTLRSVTFRFTREEAEMIEAFEFADGDKTYRCKVRMPSGSGEAWWWFTVSGDQQNYAPFRAEKGDTKKTVQPRIVGFYKHRLARLAEPPVQRNRGRPPGSGAKQVAAAAAAAEVEVEA